MLGGSLLLLLLAWPTSARAAVTFYSNADGFVDVATTTIRATFDSQRAGSIASPYAEGGITFSAPSLYILTPDYPGPTDPPPLTPVLSSNGEEDIDIIFSGHLPTAVGFETISNAYHRAQVDVYDGGDRLLASYNPVQGPNTYGFVGIASDVAIGRVHWLSNNGAVQNTAIDNVRYGSAGVNGPRQHSSLGQTLVGFGSLPGFASLGQGVWHTAGVGLVDVAPAPRPARFALGQNTPNPFTGATRIRFTLPSSDRVSLRIYDVFGRAVRTVFDRRFEAGRHDVTVRLRDAAPGLYFYRLRSSSASLTRKMLLLDRGAPSAP